MKSSILVAVTAFTLFQPEQPIDGGARNVKTDIYFDEKEIKKGLIEIDPRAMNYIKGKETRHDDSATISSRLYLSAKLKSLIADWESETKFTSSVDDKIYNSNFQKIVKFGMDIVPAILEEIHASPSQLVWALNYITGNKISSKPISINDACNAWVTWGKKMRLI